MKFLTYFYRDDYGVFYEERGTVNIEYITRIFISYNSVEAHLIGGEFFDCLGKDFVIKSCNSEEDAKNYLIALAKDFHFLLCDDDKAAINPAHIKRIFIDTQYMYEVRAEVEGDVNDTALKEFNLYDSDKNSKDVEEYLAEVVKFLNGGAK